MPDLLTRIETLGPDQAARILGLLRMDLTGDDLELRRAIEDEPEQAVAAVAAVASDVTPWPADPAAVARRALALVARDADPERRGLIEQALDAPAAPTTLAGPLEAAALLAVIVLALKTYVEISYTGEQGFRFRLRKEAQPDGLVKSVLAGLLGLFRK